MAPEPPGVGAAPNRCEIEAELLSIEQSDRFPDKWLLGIRIRASRSISGPNFARAGEAAEAFTFDPPPGLAVGAVLRAEAEFLGGPTGGKFQLSAVEVI